MTLFYLSILSDSLFCIIIFISVPQLRINDAVNKYQTVCSGTHDFAEVMCTANCEGFYGTPSAQILMCTATKLYVYILIYSTAK